MLACLRLPPRSSHLSRSVSSSSTRLHPRQKSSSNSDKDEDDDDRDALQYKKRPVTRDAGPTAEPWLADEGEKFRDPKDDGPNWLGGVVPFPMNPTFCPPPPISDIARENIYRQYMADPVKNNTRALSSSHHVSIKRVDAILRLKGLEKHWMKGKPLETGFLAGMETMLGVKRPTFSSKAARENTTEADLQAQDQGSDRSRDRYQRHFWEPVVDGQEPVVPGVLARVKADAKKRHQTASTTKSDPILLTGRTKPKKDKTLLTPPKVVRILSRGDTGRPAMVFRDVGGKFLDVEDRLKRVREGQRRKRIRHDQ